MSDIKLQVTEYRIQIDREGDKIIEQPETSEESDKYAIDLQSIHGLPEESRKVAEFNARQITYCEEDPNRSFILKRIINNNN